MRRFAQRARLAQRTSQFFQAEDQIYFASHHDLFRARNDIGPIGKVTIAEIFVNYPVLTLDNLLATKNPRSEKDIQVLALHVATEGRKTTNVRDEKPARNILDFPQRSLRHHRFVFVWNRERLPECENLISDCDLIAVGQSNRLMNPSLV